MELEESNIDSTQNHGPDIDERSDDEDDCAAHELLRGAPMVTQVVASGPPMSDSPVLSYNHEGFSVSY